MSIERLSYGLIGRLPERRCALALRLVRAVLALIAGAAAALVHPPFGFLPGLLGYPLLLILSDRSSRVRGAAWMGWLAGFAYFFVSCWWVAEAFMVDPDQAWMAPFAASLLPMGLGLFWAGACALYRRFKSDTLSRVLLFAGLFALFEWLRGHVLTGFPWNPAGAGWRAGGAASQFASVVGVYGLGLITVAGAAALAAPLLDGRRKTRVGVALTGLAVLVCLPIYGWGRLSNAQVRDTDTWVRVVQPDVEQASKWSPEAYRSIVERYVNLTGRPGGREPDVIIWPEGALPTTANAAFADGAWEGQAIARALKPGQTLILGLGRAQADPKATDGARYFNSLFALHDQGDAGLRVAAVYDKYRLVPFGEYLPLGGMMTALGIRSLVHMEGDFSPGPRPAPIALPNAPPVQPLICYESLFPGFTPGGAARPRWIVNISNDAWFGGGSGPLQHLNLASYRAIETGLPIIRSTPTGVSAFIDPWGRVIADHRLDPGESGVIGGWLPQPTGETVYGRIGDLIFWLGLVVMLGLGLPVGMLLRRNRAAPVTEE
ncbi:apolipoprotein N-acyltransferase [Brevundimonas sp. Leaf363]|uniref:apolipoprotein N-acyltransferase n=1 Tax=Brevundimonas sp. Leaf363 TaxID=1736353 RepID=UPI000B275210|nr:apolipoprotein N-acyltransferase [Brevundimonas sp. Leaf363]